MTRSQPQVLECTHSKNVASLVNSLEVLPDEEGWGHWLSLGRDQQKSCYFD